MPERLEITAPAPRSGPFFSPLEQAGVALSLLTLSVLTTISAGAVLMFHFQRSAAPFALGSGLFPPAWIIRHPESVTGGWSFSLTLLGILTAHELGHYFACRFHQVNSSLPWVLPAPTLIGTFGGVIRLRSRLPSRQALLDIGIAGPLAGMVVAIPSLIAGLLLSTTADGTDSVFQSGMTMPQGLIFLHSLVSAFHPGLLPLDQSLNPHPVFIAAWIGLFITAVNLLPAGQLDGGHILYAVSPRLHRWSTLAVTLLLVLAGTLTWIGWLVWACFLLASGPYHPPVPDSRPLSARRLALAGLGLLLFLLTFTLEPFAGGSLIHYLH